MYIVYYVYISTNKFYLQPFLLTQIPDPDTAVSADLTLQTSDMKQTGNHRQNSSTLPL